MTTRIFPQVEHIPPEIKQQVMKYIQSNVPSKPSILQKTHMMRKLMPALIMTVIVVGVLGYIKSRPQLTIPEVVPMAVNTPIETPVENTENVASSDADQVILESKLAEIESLLDELDQI